MSELRRLVAVAFAAGVLIAGAAAASTVATSMDAERFDDWGARFTIDSDCSAAENVAVVTDPSGNETACDTLFAVGTVSTATTLTAGDRVVLRDGFSVNSDTSLAVAIDSSLFPDAYLQDDSPASETTYGARFYLNPAQLNLGASDKFLHFIARDGAGDAVMTLGIKYNDAQAELRAYIEAVEDGGNVATTENASEIVLDDTQYQWVEVGFLAGAGDGEAYVCVDDLSNCITLTSLDNDTKTVDSVRWGVMDVGPLAELGSVDVDEFESQRAINIGPSPKEAP